MAGVALVGFRGAFVEAQLDPNAEIVSAYYLVGGESLSAALLLAKSDLRFEDAIWKMEIQPILNTEDEDTLEESSLPPVHLERAFESLSKH